MLRFSNPLLTRNAAPAPPASESRRELPERSRFWGKRSGIQFPERWGALSKPPSKLSGGAGNRTPVREGSPLPSFTCVVVTSLTTEFADSAATYLSLISIRLSRAPSPDPVFVVDTLPLPRQSYGWAVVRSLCCESDGCVVVCNYNVPAFTSAEIDGTQAALHTPRRKPFAPVISRGVQAGLLRFRPATGGTVMRLSAQVKKSPSRSLAGPGSGMRYVVASSRRRASGTATRRRARRRRRGGSTELNFEEGRSAPDLPKD